MIGSQNKDIVLQLYQQPMTVFTFSEVALLCGETNRMSLSKKMNYYVETGKILNPRKGIYAKPGYEKVELSVKVYTPAYLSLQYVLQKSGVIFQYNEDITAISYLSRTLHVDNQDYIYRKIKPVILYNWDGIRQNPAGIYEATPERAFLDLFYLEPDYYFDFVDGLDGGKIIDLLSVYSSAALQKRVKKVLNL